MNNNAIVYNDFELLDKVIYKKQFVDIYKSNKVIDLNEVALQEDEVCDVKYVIKNEFKWLIIVK